MFDEQRLYYDEDTLVKVYAALAFAGIYGEKAREAVNNMQNVGILFRERLVPTTHPDSKTPKEE
jgi:hypothetical protein